MGVLTVFLFALVYACLWISPSRALAEVRRAFSRVAPTNCAAVFSLPDVDGRVRALAAERGRPVLVHFFATWCEACKAEFGTLQHFFEARKKALAVFAVSVGEVPGRVRIFLKDTPVSFPVLLDADRSVAKAWAVDGLPTTIVLNKNLRPILAVNGDLDWASAEVSGEIEEALARDPDSKIADCAKENSP